MFRNPLHGIREISGAIRAWVIGMGPLEFEKLKSICLVGPPGSGKKHIVYALAAEVGAVIFNLSTEIVVKYKNQMPYFVNLVKKMARILQPTILFIGGAHKPFIKKVIFVSIMSQFKFLSTIFSCFCCCNKQGNCCTKN